MTIWFRVKKLLFYLILLFHLNAKSEGNPDLTGVVGTLKSVEKAIIATVTQSEKLYEQNAGANMGAGINMITRGNLFLSILEIRSDYKIKLQFANSDPTISGSSGYKIPVAQVLLNKIIVFIPMTGELGSGATAVISSWSCATNADDGASIFMGDNTEVTEGNTSFIGLAENAGDNPYISACVFVSPSSLDALLSPGVGGPLVGGLPPS